MNQAYLKYLLSLLLFGLNGIVASCILLNSYEIVFLRTFIGSLSLTSILILSKVKLQFYKNKKHLIHLIISGISMGMSWMFLYEAYSEIGVSIATLAYYCGPVIVMALSPFIFNEQITIFKTLGLLIVLIGIIFINNCSTQQNNFSWGLICGILSAIMYAVMVIFNKKAKSITGLENAVLQLVISFITVAVFMTTKQPLPVSAVLQNLLPVLFLGVVNTGIGCYLYFSSIQQLPAASVSILGYLEPLSALIFSSIFLHERLSIVQILGTVFIIGGAAIGELSIYNSSIKK